MTVSTVVAGLLPIFWSTRVGSEVIRPLATPVLGGMLSSLAHVLIVTPIIFLWLRERELRRGHERAGDISLSGAAPGISNSLQGEDS
jgi:Cu(I)/Ag(I) efflux system membrane protein CusA/SilA